MLVLYAHVFSGPTAIVTSTGLPWQHWVGEPVVAVFRRDGGLAPLRGGVMQGGLIRVRDGIDGRSFSGPGVCGALHGDNDAVDVGTPARRRVAIARLDTPPLVVWLAAGCRAKPETGGSVGPYAASRVQ